MDKSYFNISLVEYKIVIIRHGEPVIGRKRFYSRREMLLYDEEYFNSNIKPFAGSPISVPTDCQIYHSPLRRAAHTAELLFPKAMLISDNRFREFERGVIYNSLLRLPLKVWKIASRILWFFGISKAESFTKARRRAKENALFLQDKAIADGMAIVVAHGLHNRFVVRNLLQLGWYKLYNSGYGYLGMQVLVKSKLINEDF